MNIREVAGEVKSAGDLAKGEAWYEIEKVGSKRWETHGDRGPTGHASSET